MFLSSKNLVRHFWMMWSTKSDSGIRFSDCRSFSKDFTWEMEITLTCESRKAFTELCETARDLSCKTARLFVALNIQNIWGVCVCLRPGLKRLDHLHIVSFFVRHEGQACDACQPAVLHQRLLGLKTQSKKTLQLFESEIHAKLKSSSCCSHNFDMKHAGYCGMNSKNWKPLNSFPRLTQVLQCDLFHELMKGYKFTEPKLHNLTVISLYFLCEWSSCRKWADTAEEKKNI